MEQLYSKIKAKENEAREKIEQKHEEVNLKAVLAAQKKIMEKFKMAFSKVDVDISELIMSKVIAATCEETKEEKSCIKEMKKIHAIIATTLQEDIVKFNTLFDRGLKVIKAEKKA
jgi:hypothetical protein